MLQPEFFPETGAQTFSNTASSGIILIDRTFMCLEWNKGMEQIAGIPGTAIKGKRLSDEFPLFCKSRHLDAVMHLFAHPEEIVVLTTGFWKPDKNQFRFTYFPLKAGADNKENFCMVLVERMPETEVKRQLEKLKTEYRTLAEHSGVGIWQIDPQGYTLYMNPEMCRILGIDSWSELRDKTFHGFFTPESLEVMKEEHRKRTEKESSDYEVELIRKDGTIRNMLINGAPLLNKEGQLEGMIATFIDLTEKKASEKELAKSEERFRNLFEKTKIPTGISRKGIHTMVNRAYVKLFGYDSPEELVGTSILNLIAPSEHEMIGRYIQARFEGKEVPNSYETRGLKKDGSEFPFHVQISYIDMPEGMATVVSIKDISERKAAEAALKASEARFRGIFESDMLGLFFTDPERRILNPNKKFQDMIGYSEEEILETGLTWDMITPPDMIPRDIESEKEFFAKGYFTPYEKEYIRKDGTKLPILLASSRIGADPPLSVACVVDITELQKTRNESLRLATELSTFLYMASHDLKGPLASIIGLAGVALGETKDPVALNYFRMIRDCTLKLDKTLMHFMKLIRIKNQSFTRDEIDFKTMAEEVIESLRHRPGFEEVEFKTEISLKGTFFSDEDLIRSVIQNLLENGAKYTTRYRKPLVRLTVTTQDSGIEIRVQDTGRGIDEKIKDRIFDMFYRGDISSKGSGLGLFIVKSAVETLKGTVEVFNNPEGGACFTVRLPQQEQ